MQKPLISLSILLFALQGCSGKPAGFQGDAPAVQGAGASGDATGERGSRDSESGDATGMSGDANAETDDSNTIEAYTIETQSTEMEAAGINEVLDATVSVGNIASDNSSASSSNSTSPAPTSNNGSSTSNSSTAPTSDGSSATSSNSNSTSNSSSSTSTSNSNTSTSTSPTQPASPAQPLTLSVTVPSTSIRPGTTAMQATAKVSGQTAAPAVTWTATASGNQNAGTISDSGLYTPPANGNGGYDVILTATLMDDPSVSSSVTIKVIAPEQIFVSCQQGSLIFPIKADVYQLPVNTNRLPDFSTLTKLTTVCMDQYDVAPRSWTSGFPGVTGLFEWFALRTSTRVTVPAAGQYTFKLNSDDGAKLYIDGNLIIDNDGQHAAASKEASVTLTAGAHDLKIDYFQGPREHIALELFWKTGSDAYTYVPKASLK